MFEHSVGIQESALEEAVYRSLLGNTSAEILGGFIMHDLQHLLDEDRKLNCSLADLLESSNRLECTNHLGFDPYFWNSTRGLDSRIVRSLRNSLQ